jgi:hypothetical protein
VSNLVDLVSKPGHLVARFFRSLPSTPPSVAEEVWADEHLLTGERALWVQLSNQDRRHSIGVAQRFDDVRRGASRAQTAGALLHDVGKIECQLGTFARVAATLLGPRTERFRLYHDHEEIGARLALDAGSAPETVDLIAGRGPAYSDLCTCDF